VEPTASGQADWISLLLFELMTITVVAQADPAAAPVGRSAPVEDLCEEIPNNIRLSPVFL